MNKKKQMKNQKKERKGSGRIFMLLALLFGIGALFCYLTTGKTEFTPDYEERVIVLYAIFCACALLCFLFTMRIGRVLTYGLGLWAFLEFIVCQLNYIANIFVSIDPTPVTVEFLITAVCGLTAFVCALISALKTKKKEGK